MHNIITWKHSRDNQKCKMYIIILSVNTMSYNRLHANTRYINTMSCNNNDMTHKQVVSHSQILLLLLFLHQLNTFINEGTCPYIEWNAKVITLLCWNHILAQFFHLLRSKGAQCNRDLHDVHVTFCWHWPTPVNAIVILYSRRHVWISIHEMYKSTVITNASINLHKCVLTKESPRHPELHHLLILVPVLLSIIGRALIPSSS